MGKMENNQQLYRECEEAGEGGHPPKALRDPSYLEFARKLSLHQGTVVGVFWDASFKGMEVPKGLRLADIADTWGSLPGVWVVPLDVYQIRSYTILFKGKMDILVFPYGSVFPMDAMHLYTAQTFNQYLKRGGAILTTGGIPFMKQAGPDGEICDISTPKQMTSVYDRWVSKFGIKYYETPTASTRQVVHQALLPSLPDTLDGIGNRYGILVANSSHEPVPKPPHGNVFPERYPARTVIPLLSGADPYGEILSTSAVLVQDFENGSRRIHFSHDGDRHPLAPDSCYFKELMQNLFRLLQNQVIAKEVETGYACYRDGEAVAIRSAITNHSDTPQLIGLSLEIADSHGIVHRAKKDILVESGEHVETWSWNPGKFCDDEYRISLQVLREDRVVSVCENGFVVWDPSRIVNQNNIGIRNQYFTVDGKGTFITGTNYYESTRGEIMWFRPDVWNIIRDYRAMHQSAVNLIRPHYHHTKWFKDYLLYTYGSLFPFFKDLASLDDAQPDEKAWRIWDLFIYLSQKYAVLYGGDLFTLVPEEMGDPRGWFGTAETVYDPEKRLSQKTFLRNLETRYREIPGITWDLFNEPYKIPDSDVNNWACDLQSVFAELGSKRLLTVGGMGGGCGNLDYDSPHGKISEGYINRGEKPVLIQEVHVDTAEPLEAEIEQGEAIRQQIVCTLRNGMAGICPWSWTRQLRLWQDTYEHHHTFPMEKWDDRLGMHTHEDGTMKIAGRIFKDLGIFFKKIDLIRYDDITQSTQTSRGILKATLADQKTASGHKIYHTQEERCFGAMDRGDIVWSGRTLAEGPCDSYLLFFAEDRSFDEADELFVKTESAGRLTLFRTGCVKASLVDYTGSGMRGLEELAVDRHLTKEWYLSLSIEPEMCRYWLRLRF
jgi:hypothetical protein